jgi:hypothetical protein
MNTVIEEFEDFIKVSVGRQDFDSHFSNIFAGCTYSAWYDPNTT